MNHLCFRLTIRNVNFRFRSELGTFLDSFRLTIRNVNQIFTLLLPTLQSRFRLTIRNVNEYEGYNLEDISPVLD